MRRSLAIALLVLGATVGVWAQNTDAASDRIVVVGNRAQPVQWNHRESIQDAINAAKPNGTVIIPSSYGGTDCNPVSNCNPGSVTVQDWRTNGGGSGVNCGGINAIVFQSAIGQFAICDPNATLDGNGNMQLTSLTTTGDVVAGGAVTATGAVTGSSLATSGPGGLLKLKAQTPPVAVPVNEFHVFLNTNTGLVDCLNNALTHCLGAVQTIALGTTAMGTAAITSGACASVVTVTATGTATTDTIAATPNVDPTGVSGYGPSASGSLYIQAYPTANNVNFKVCNNTAGTITPAALSLNWAVRR
jgi:hypothetical protein